MSRTVPYGNYELLRKVAAGGMAEIFLARYHTEHGFSKEVAIKRLFPNLSEHQDVRQMFQDEALLLSYFSHPNIPQVYDLGVEGETWFVAMEYIDGWNLADVWRMGARAGKIMPLHVALGTMVQVAEAAHYVHQARDRSGRHLSVVHRDITPQNIMLTRSGVVKLMDFGVAQTALRSSAPSGTPRGTMSYMAPEQVRGKHIDGRSDVFAMGVILYELTTGCRLYRGTESQIMTAIVEKDPPRPSQQRTDYPADLEEIVMAALRREPDERIATAEELVLHLEHFAMRHGLILSGRALSQYLNTIALGEPLFEQEMLEDEGATNLKTGDDSNSSTGEGMLSPFVGFDGTEPEETKHVVIIDESTDSKDEYVKSLTRRFELGNSV